MTLSCLAAILHKHWRIQLQAKKELCTVSAKQGKLHSVSVHEGVAGGFDYSSPKHAIWNFYKKLNYIDH